MTAPPPQDAADGILVIDKPKGPTSFDLVARARRAYRTREIGHAGTLDPLATGVLVLLVGRATRLQRILMDHDKRYRATVAFGARTSSDDAAGEIVERGDPAGLTEERVRAALEGFVGAQRQVPPAHSAIHIDGERAYAKARRGEEVVMQARDVVFHSLTLEHFAAGVAVVDVLCSKGTYIRALARDLGVALGVPAHLGALARTASGGYTLDDAHPASVLDDADAARAGLLTGRAALRGVTILDVDDGVRTALRQGKRVPSPARFDGIAIAAQADELVALVEQHDGVLRSVRGF